MRNSPGPKACPINVCFYTRLYLQNICILIIGVLNILNHFQPARYLDLSIKLADHYKLPGLLVLSVLLHGGLSAYCQLQEKCIEMFAKEITFVFFSAAITMKVSVIIDTLLRKKGIIQFFWKCNRVNPELTRSDPAVRYTAESSDANIVSIEFQPSLQEENTEQPETAMKHHLVSFRTGMLFILSIVIVGLAVNVYYTYYTERKFHSSEFYYFLYVVVIPLYTTVVVMTNHNLRNYSKTILVKIINTLF